MTKLIDLNSQIEKLQKQADEIRNKEFVSTVVEIQKLMTAFGITPKDLQRSKKKLVKPSSLLKAKSNKTTKATRPVAAKYKGPNGETWSGRGLMPKWLTTLIKSGHTKEAFLITIEQKVA